MESKKITKQAKIEIPAIPEEKEVLYIKRGSGRMVLRNRLIKPNEKFYAKPSSIPKAFLNMLEVLPDSAGDVKPTPAPKRPSDFRIVLAEDSEVNKDINEQIEELEGFDFSEDENLTELRQSLKDNGNEALADLDKEVLKDAILETLKAQYEYNIVNAKGKVQNEKVLNLQEAEKFITML